MRYLGCYSDCIKFGCVSKMDSVWYDYLLLLRTEPSLSVLFF